MTDKIKFYELQGKWRKKSLVLFAIISVYYLAAFLVLAFAVKIIYLIQFTYTSSAQYAAGNFRDIGFFDVPQLIMLAVLSFLVAWLQISYASENAVRIIKSTIDARDPKLDDPYHKKFINVVEEMSAGAGGIRVKPLVIPRLAVNAFAMGNIKGERYIGATEGLISRLTRRQLMGVVSHEMAHIFEGDHIINTYISATFGIFEKLKKKMIKSAGRIFYNPIIYALLSFFQTGGRLLKMAVSRKREFLADATAVQLTRDPLALAEALDKVSRSNRGFGMFSAGMSPIFIASPSAGSLSEKRGLLSRMFSSHPPVGERIKLLRKQAHSDIFAVKKTKYKKNNSSQRWRVYQKGKWSKPMPLENMPVLESFTAQTWVCREGTQKVVKAADSKDIAAFLGRKITEDPVISESDYSCPLCKQPLVLIEYEGTEILKCLSCKGHLAGWINLQKIIARKEKKFSISDEVKDGFRLSREERKKLFAKEKKSDLRCPKCDYYMRTSHYSFECFITVDRCMRCGEVWFDCYELELLQEAFDKGGER